jgi:hypothetical protein
MASRDHRGFGGFSMGSVATWRTFQFFVDADRGADGNFAYRVKQGYSHGGTAAMEYTYNGMKAFWGGKDAAAGE